MKIMKLAPLSDDKQKIKPIETILYERDRLYLEFYLGEALHDLRYTFHILGSTDALTPKESRLFTRKLQLAQKEIGECSARLQSEVIRCKN